MALKKIILNAEEINLPTKLSDLENDLGLGGGDIDTSNFATKETVMTSEIAVYADGFRTSNGDWFAFPGTESENNADFCIAIVDDIPTKTSQLTNDSNFITTDDIPKEVELINIAGNMTSSSFAFTASEVSAIINAYDAGKTVILNPTRSNFSTGWVVPTIKKQTVSTQYKIYISYYLGGIYGEITATYNTNTASVTMNSVSISDTRNINSNIVEIDDPTAISLNPNKTHIVTVVVSSITIDSIVEPTTPVAEYALHFFTGSSVGEFVLPDNVFWANGTAPTLEEGTAYELSVVATTISGNYVYKAVLTPFKLVES